MSISQIKIRLATPADANDIAAVLGLAFEGFRELYTDEGYAATTPDSEVIIKRWAEGPVWVAILEGNIVATVGAVPKKEGLYIRSMAVLPAERGKRIGDLLLGTVEHFARQQRIGRLFLSTTPFLLAAIRLYENFGFQRKEEIPGGLFGTPLFRMEKELKR